MNTNIHDLEFTLGDGEDMSFFRITDAKASFHFRPLHCQGNELNISNLRVGMLQIKYQQPHYNQAQMALPDADPAIEETASIRVSTFVGMQIKETEIQVIKSRLPSSEEPTYTMTCAIYYQNPYNAPEARYFSTNISNELFTHLNAFAHTHGIAAPVGYPVPEPAPNMTGGRRRTYKNRIRM